MTTPTTQREADERGLPPLPAQHEELRARWKCEDCDGTGEVGELIDQGYFQPPERARCSTCDGAGQVPIAAYTDDQMRDYARAATDQPSAGQVDERAAFEAWLSTDTTYYMDTRDRLFASWRAARASLTPTAPQAASPAEPIYQASMRGGWEDIERWQFDLHNDNGDGSIKTRIVYAAPQAATTGSADNSEFLATLQGAAKEATDEWIAGFVRQHFGIYAAATASAQAQQDAVKFGSSITKTHADGSIERIDPLSIYKESEATTASASTVTAVRNELFPGPSIRDVLAAKDAEIADLRAALARAPLPAQEPGLGSQVDPSQALPHRTLEQHHALGQQAGESEDSHHE